MDRAHQFIVQIRPDWQGDEPPASARKMRRRHQVVAGQKPPLSGSAASAFHGEAERWNPEELFVASLAQCHLLSLLYVVDRDGSELLDYTVEAEGILTVKPEGLGSITQVTIRPAVTVPPGGKEALVRALQEAHELCFIARSVSCEVTVEPTITEVSPPNPQL